MLETADVFCDLFFILTKTMTATVAITTINRMAREAAAIIPASEILSKFEIPKFQIFIPIIVNEAKSFSGGNFT